MKSYIPQETAAIFFFLANLFPKQGISSEYVTADFICMDLLVLQGAKTKLQNEKFVPIPGLELTTPDSQVKCLIYEAIQSDL